MEQFGEGIRKLILAGVGAVAVTKEKSEAVVRELIKKGELTVEQGKVLNEELKHNIKEAIRENVQVNVVEQPDDLMDAVDGMDDAQLEALKQRIQAAEQARKAQPAPESGEAAPEAEPAAKAEEPTEETKAEERGTHMPVRSEDRAENRQRLMEIMEVVRRHELVKGMTPEKLCAVMEDLGPTFIKLGQILSMRSDFLPKSYCEALKKLRSSVAPTPLTSRRWAALPSRRRTRPCCKAASALW